MNTQEEFQISVKRTKRRKTISLKIIDGFVQVVVPDFVSDSEINLLVSKKRKWIRNKLKIQKLIPSFKPKEFISGEAFLYLGKNYRLKVKKGKETGVLLKGGYFMVTVKDSNRKISHELESWFKEKAQLKFEQKTANYAKKLNVLPKNIFIKDYKSRWGSCSVDGDITYNWRLIMAPHSIIDYVVIHELCHLKHHDHSKKYWNTVHSFFPDYKKQKDWLRVNANLLKW